MITRRGEYNNPTYDSESAKAFEQNYLTKLQLRNFGKLLSIQNKKEPESNMHYLNDELKSNKLILFRNVAT